MAKAKITRIKAGDDSNNSSTKSTASSQKSIKPSQTIKDPKKLKNKIPIPKSPNTTSKLKNPSKRPFFLFRPFVATWHYTKNSWREIRQVRWPNRKTTWKMVVATMIYSAFFAIILFLLDTLFSFIFNQILK